LSKLKIIANKHNPARSGVDQPCDKAETFKIIKSIQKDYTVKYTPMYQHPMKKRVHDIFTKLKNADRLDLKANKRNALVNFIYVVP